MIQLFLVLAPFGLLFQILKMLYIDDLTSFGKSL